MRSQKFWDWFDSFAAPKLNEWPQMARESTFRKMFEHLDSFDRPVHIIETGCIEDPDNWAGNGCSTILFSKYIAAHHGSTAVSIEINQEKVDKARDICSNMLFYVGDSVEELRQIAKGPHEVDLLYLDASNHNWMGEMPSQVHHYNELMAIMPMLHEDTLVAVDDTIAYADGYPQNKIAGKGGLVAQYAFEVGAELKFCKYQTGFTKITGASPTDIEQVETLVLRARALVESGNMAAADWLYRLVLHVTAPPWTGRARIARGEACANFGRNAWQMQKYGIAVEWFRDALVADPFAVDYRNEMARSLVSLGALNIARREASIATHMEPDNPRAWATLGAVESDMLDERACIEAYDKQIETSVETSALGDALLNRAAIGLDTKDYELVRLLCARLIKMGTRKGDAYHCLAMLEYRISNHEKALEYFDKAFEFGVQNPPLAHWNKSLPLQSIGRLRESWEDHYWRENETTQPALYLSSRRFNMPKWKGEPAPATIHVHTEAGHGDNIALLRYLPLMVEQGYTVHYEADLKLVDLVRQSMPQVEVMARSVNYPGSLGLKPFDYHIPIGDLPHVFKTDIDTIPWNGPYLKADPDLSNLYGQQMAKGRKIGLCWSSGIRREMNIWMEKYGRMKSMHFNDIGILGGHGEHFYSLQIGDGREEAKGHYITDILPANPDWTETAALIDNLDLVITVDTGVAHLSAAMGKPTWVMMQRDGASWHFMCYRPGASWNEASPWYPSARLFRQHEFNTPGYWKDVVDDIVKALEKQKWPTFST